MRTLGLCLALVLAGTPAFAASSQDLTTAPVGYLCLLLFALAYGLVMLEEKLHIRKSLPVVIAAGVMWSLIGLAFQGVHGASAETALRHFILEFGELFLFLLAAMTFINTMEDRHVFRGLRSWLVRRRLSLKALFWVTGLMAFFISPVADNLTTALLMGAVLMAVGRGKPGFLTVGCINLVVAANAGGAFSPFGDITTLMVWQAGRVEFWEFFRLFIPSLVNWLVPAFLMSFAVEPGRPVVSDERVPLRPGAVGVIVLFLFTIAMAVVMHARLGLPPVLGMTTGLGLLKLYGEFLRRRYGNGTTVELCEVDVGAHSGPPPDMDPQEYFDVFRILEKAEWDTLMFFYGVILCVGALGTLGYLTLASHYTYGTLGATSANTVIGLLSAVVDNIPIMVAVLAMKPDLSLGQWLLVTLTAGVGGSILSIGSAAGVALMGQARGVYTFLSHLRWAWAVAAGYAASIWVHFLVNGGTF